MKRPNESLTTGRIARVADVSARMVAKWFDAGLLKGFLLPGSQDRRVPRDEVIRFLTAHGMPLGELAGPGGEVVLAVGLDPHDARRVADALGGAFRVEAAADLFAAGVLFRTRRPRVVVADDALGAGEVRLLADALAREGVPLVCLVGADARGGVGAEAFRHPIDPAAVAAAIRRRAAAPRRKRVRKQQVTA